MSWLRCWFEGVLETLTLAGFWTSGGNVTVSGHIWPDKSGWSEPLPSPDPGAWPGLVEHERATCERCGAEIGDGWRPFYGRAS